MCKFWINRKRARTYVFLNAAPIALYYIRKILRWRSPLYFTFANYKHLFNLFLVQSFRYFYAVQYENFYVTRSQGPTKFYLAMTVKSLVKSLGYRMSIWYFGNFSSKKKKKRETDINRKQFQRNIMCKRKVFWAKFCSAWCLSRFVQNVALVICLLLRLTQKYEDYYSREANISFIILLRPSANTYKHNKMETLFQQLPITCRFVVFSTTFHLFGVMLLFSSFFYSHTEFWNYPTQMALFDTKT